MARMSEASPVFTIIFLTLFLVASVLSGAFYQEITKSKARIRQKEKQITKAKKAYNTMFDYNVQAAEIVTGEERLDIEKIKMTLKSKRSSLPTSEAENIFMLLSDYSRELEKKRRDLKNTKTKQLLSDDLLVKERKKTMIRIENMEVTLKEKSEEVKRLRKEMTSIRSEFKTQIDKLKNDGNQIVISLNNQISKLKGKDLSNSTKIKTLQARIATLTKVPEIDESKITPLKPFNNEKELPDGHIVNIDNELRVAILDIGRKHGVKRGLRFNIYRDSGLAQRHLKGQVIVRKVHDSICEAFVIYQRGFGQDFYLTGEFSNPPKRKIIEMVKEVGGKIAEEFNNNVEYLIVGKSPNKTTITKAQELRIPALREHLVTSFLTSSDTIKSSDIAINPAFSTNHRERFLLYGEFSSPESLLKEKIKSYGSQIVDLLDLHTDYLVIGSEVGQGNKKMIRKANDLGVVIMKEEELLAFLND